MTEHDLRCPAPQYWHSPGTAMATCQCDLIAKVRADEVERRFGWVSREDARAWFLADLRAKVEALPQDGGGRVWRSDVLDLLDGGSDE